MSLRVALFNGIMAFMCAASLSACKETPRMMKFPPSVVEVTPVQVGIFQDKSEFLGTMKSRKSVTLSPHVDGHITDIAVKSGQVVHAGDLVMKIDSRMQSAQENAVEAGADSLQSDIANARATLAALESTLRSKNANVDFTKTQFERYGALEKDGAVAKTDLDTWTNNYNTAQADRDSVLQQIEAQKMTIQKYERNYKQALANVRAQKEQLRYYDIRAPFTGIIGDVSARVGDHVTSSTALTTLTENHPLELYMAIPAEKASLIKNGSLVSLRSADGQNYGSSEVTFVSPTVDPGSQTVLLKALYSNDKSVLRVDQTVRAEIVWQERPGISVPTKAVTQSAGKFFVFVAENGKRGNLAARQAEIEVSGIEGSSYQVKSGLKPTDRIVTSGIQRLADGAQIVAREASFQQGESTAQSKQDIH